MAIETELPPLSTGIKTRQTISDRCLELLTVDK